MSACLKYVVLKEKDKAMIHDFGSIIFSWIMLSLLVILALVIFIYSKSFFKKKP